MSGGALTYPVAQMAITAITSTATRISGITNVGISFYSLYLIFLFNKIITFVLWISISGNKAVSST
jgi:hypothetical protein